MSASAALRDRLSDALSGERFKVLMGAGHAEMAYLNDPEVVADVILDALGLVEGMAFAPQGIDNAVGVLMAEPAEPKFQAGQTIYVMQFGRSADR